METNIVAVKYESQFIPRTFEGKSYSYFTNVKLNEGDIVEGVVRNRIIAAAAVSMRAAMVEWQKVFIIAWIL